MNTNYNCTGFRYLETGIFSAKNRLNVYFIYQLCEMWVVTLSIIWYYKYSKGKCIQTLYRLISYISTMCILLCLLLSCHYNEIIFKPLKFLYKNQQKSSESILLSEDFCLHRVNIRRFCALMCICMWINMYKCVTKVCFLH